MRCFTPSERVRIAIDSRLKGDLITTARQQGFVFSNPSDDLPIWHQVAQVDLENPAYMCSPEVADWLFSKAIEATLFQLYLPRPMANQGK